MPAVQPALPAEPALPAIALHSLAFQLPAVETTNKRARRIMHAKQTASHRRYTGNDYFYSGALGGTRKAVFC